MFIHIITGPVGSGKSAAVLQEYHECVSERLCLTCSEEYRIVSRNGLCTKAEQFPKLYEGVLRLVKKIEKRQIEYIFIDEIQFLEFHLAYAFLNNLAGLNVRIISAGLEMDSRAVPFESTGLFFARANTVDKKFFVCKEQRYVRYSLDLQNNLSNKCRERYTAVCERCFLSGKKICEKTD